MQTWNLILRKKKRASNQVKHRIKTLIAGLNEVMVKLRLLNFMIGEIESDAVIHLNHVSIQF